MSQDFDVSREFTGLSINHHEYAPDEPPPPPIMSSEGIIATDITQKFLSAAAALESGELVKDGYFTLFESVGALEIMDSKMDSGCLEPGESLDDDYDVTRQLLPSEVLGIIDQLLSLEMAWHLGYPLSQTLLTNVYIEAMLNPAPTSLQEAHFIRDPDHEAAKDPMLLVLRAYCLGMLKACWYVNERIKFEHYYEEEDFVTNTYHRSLLDDIDRYEIRDEIMAARNQLHNLRTQIGEPMAMALGFRLELRTAFLRAIELEELRSNLDSLSLPWHQMQGVWEQINQSRHLGTPVPESFSTKLQRRLASTMPPRPIVQLGFEETYEHFKKFFADGIDVLKVLNYVDSQSLLNFILTFQAQKPQPLVYIRTLLQNFLFKDMVVLSHLSIRHVIDDDLAIVVLPCSCLLDPTNDDIEVPSDSRHAIAHQMESFRQRAAHTYLDIFRAFCLNRCRVRRTLCHSIQDWEALQLEAEDLDLVLQEHLKHNPPHYISPVHGTSYLASEPEFSLPLSSWAYLYKLRLMEWTVQLGFELNTYQSDELASMYWYLSFLAKARAAQADRIKGFTTKRLDDLRLHLTPSMKAKFERSFAYLRVTALDAAVTLELANALSNLYTVLRRLGLIVPPPRPYSRDELRYEIRMKPFAPITLPETPSYEAFKAATDQQESTSAELLDYAQAAVGGAKKGLEALSKMTEKEAFTAGTHERWVKGKKDCLKSVIAVGIAISAVKKALQTGDGGKEGAARRLSVEVPKAEKCYCDWWIVPKVTGKGEVEGVEGVEEV